MLRIVLTIVQLFSSLAIIGLVLLQRGKGAEAGAGFGAGASGTVFGARGATTALSRATAIFAAVFMLNSLALAYMGTRTAAQPKTILDVAGESAPKPATRGAARTAPGTGQNSPGRAAPTPAPAGSNAPEPSTTAATPPSPSVPAPSTEPQPSTAPQDSPQNAPK